MQMTDVQAAALRTVAAEVRVGLTRLLLSHGARANEVHIYNAINARI